MKKEYFILIFLITIACDQKELRTIKVDSVKHIDQPLSDFFQVEDKVCLSLEGRSYISRIDKITETDLYYLVLNQFDQNGVFIFNKKGKFIKSFSVENIIKYNINQVYDVIFHKNTDEIEILTTSKIIFIDHDDLSIQNVKRLEIGATRFFKNKNDYYFYCSGGNNGLVQLPHNLDLDQKLTYFPWDGQSFFHKMLPFNSFTSYDNEAFYFRNYDNTIYKITESGLKPDKFFDFMQEEITNSEKEKITDPRDVTDIKNKKLLNKFYFETKSHIYFAFFENDTISVCLYNRDSENRNCFNVRQCKNDITNDVTFPFIMNTNRKGNFLAIKNMERDQSTDSSYCKTDFMVYELSYTNR